MAIISNTTKIDKSFKFVNGKGYTTSDKGVDNEDVSSGFIIGTSSIFLQDPGIPTTAPGATTSVLTFYGDGTSVNRFRMIYDLSSPLNKAWYASTNGTSLTTMRATRVSNWIPSSFGNYTIRIFLTLGSSTSTAYLQEIFFSDSTAPLFDYKTGVLTFESDPLAAYAGIAGGPPDGIQISGYVYAGSMLNDAFDGYGRLRVPLTDGYTNPGTALAFFDTVNGFTISSPTGASGTLFVNPPDTDGYAIGSTGKGTGSAFYGIGGNSDGWGVVGIGGPTNSYGGGFQGAGTGAGVIGIGGASNGGGLYGIGTAAGPGVIGAAGGTGVGVFGIGGTGGNGYGVEGVGGANADGVVGQGTGVGTGVTGFGGVTGGAGMSGIGTGSGYGAIFQGGTSGYAIRANATTSGGALIIAEAVGNVAPQILFKDSSGNTKSQFNHLGYHMGRYVEIAQNWQYFDEAIFAGVDISAAHFPGWWIIVNANMQITAKSANAGGGGTVQNGRWLELAGVGSTLVGNAANAITYGSIGVADQDIVIAAEWEAKISATGNTNQDFFVGLTNNIAITDEAVGFMKFGGGSTVNGATGSATSQWRCYARESGGVAFNAPSGITYVADEWQRFYMELHGSATPVGVAAGNKVVAHMYINGSLVLSSSGGAASVVNTNLTFGGIVITTTNGGAQNLGVGPIKVWFTRYANNATV